MVKRNNIYLIIFLFIMLYSLILGNHINYVYAIDYPSIEFIYENNIYKWNLNNINNQNNYYEIFNYQKQYLENNKNGLYNIYNKFKNQNLSDKEIILKLLPNFKTTYTKMIKDIEKEFKETTINFKPNNKNMFNFEDGQIGIEIDNHALLKDILSGKNKINIHIHKKQPKFNKEILIQNCTKRSNEFTSFAGSEEGRKYNLQKAMNLFNGLVVMPNEIISFNEILQTKDDGTPYKDAIIIVNGEFVKGKGGGICQASTTIYNAVLMAGLEILEVHRHTLPVRYVEKGFDAMVNDNGIDMKFKNNTDMPIYIKTYSKNEKVYAEVYGKSLNGIKYKKVSEKIKDIEPNSPKIIPDNEKKYISKIKYKGEFYTEKYPKKGYEVKGYLYTYKDNKLISIKLIRHEKYASRQGIIYEGIENPPIIENIIEQKNAI